MRWEEISMSVLGQATWQIPVIKNGRSHRVPLVPEALEILQERKRRATTDRQWVFPSAESKSGHLTDMKRSWQRLLDRAQIADVRIHDLRRTLGSWMAGANVALPIIGKALGHKRSASTEIYSRLQLDQVRAAMSLAIQGMKASRTATIAQINKSEFIKTDQNGAPTILHSRFPIAGGSTVSTVIAKT